MKKKDINSREDGVTKDMQPETKGTRPYRFPGLLGGEVIVHAKSMKEALLLVKKEVKK